MESSKLGVLVTQFTYHPISIIPDDQLMQESHNTPKLIVEDIVRHGYAIVPNCLPDTVLLAMLNEVHRLDDSLLKPAGIGRGRELQINPDIRSDQICWLDDGLKAAAPYLALMSELQGLLNRQLYLGLQEYECHWAHYPEGSFYRRHLDAFAGSANRRVSTALYLNPDWCVDWGGELILYDQTKELQRVLPCMGTLVVFLSDEFPHEVLPTRRSRYSLTGWFRIREAGLP